MTDPTPRFRWGWPPVSRVLMGLACITFAVWVCGGSIGQLNLLGLGLALMSAGWFLG